MGPFGRTFAPTAEAAAETKQNNPLQGEQSVVKIQHFDLPTNPNNAPVATALLRPKPNIGGAQTPDKAVIASVLRALLGGEVSLPAGPAALADTTRGFLQHENDLNGRTGGASVSGAPGGSSMGGADSSVDLAQEAQAPARSPVFGFGDPLGAGGNPAIPEPPTGPFSDQPNYGYDNWEGDFRGSPPERTIY